MKVMIYELWGSGHRYHYVRELVIALSEVSQNIDIIFVTSFLDSQSNEFLVHLHDIKNLYSLDNDYRKDCPTQDITLWEASGYIIKACKNHNPQHVFVPTANGILQYLGVRRFLGSGKHLSGIEIEAMLMGGGIIQGWRNHIGGTLWRYFTKLTNCYVVHVLYPLQKKVYNANIPKIANEILLTPEPVETPVNYSMEVARKKLGIPVNGQYIIEAGVIDKRKGADYLLQAFSKIETNVDIKLLLAGKVSEELKELLSNQYKKLIENETIIVLDEYLTEDQFTATFLAANIFCLPYRDLDISSGIAVRAAAYRCPLLTSNTGWVGSVIPRYQLGNTCDVTNPTEFSKMILHTLELAKKYQLTQAGKIFTNYHTIDNFRAHWMKRVRQRMNLPEDENYVAWDDSI
jgi:glycosyltransferase involved in cell wall biosynthesis